jgi:hypothetical protein
VDHNGPLGGLSLRLKAGAWVALLLVVAACTDEPTQDSAPRITESETGQVVGQPIEVSGLSAEVNDNGVTLTLTATVPSDCHQPMYGFEEHNDANVLVGEAESWLDPDCSPAEGENETTVRMEIPDLPTGDYTATIEGLETEFTIP